MRIKELYATFGSLDNKQLSLKSGLNIVHGRNEAGKSTWGAFIRAMLYGISTREKAKTGYIPDKERYLPWNGNPMYGKCTLISDGDEISIERTSGKSGVFSKVEAKNLSRGSAAPTGEELCGIARGVYDRCAFIGQARLGLDRDADTEKKILSLASSGEESVSAQEVLSRLEKRQRLIRSP
ncbi:MAG: AAA family ATPase, partial [Oscillospiraceae bacterium]|nr:AAA family ATPase [Oscillospiraceae bacterium]